MAWYSGAEKMELQPESDSQPAIRPTQLIVHSIIAPWTARRMYEYWRDSTNLDSHFGLGYDGDLGQYIGTETRADANYLANRRPDGTGAISIETASNLQGTDPWTEPQIEELIALGVWLHKTHDLPLRICRTADDPGYGYHRLHAEWAVSGTACPGDARVKQFKERVFPGIVARANGQTTPPPEDDVTPEQDKRLKTIEQELKAVKAGQEAAAWRYKGSAEPRDAYDYLRTTARQVAALAKAVDALEPVDLTDAQLAALASKLAAHPTLAEQIAEKVAAKLAVRLAD
ncbi:N-acetylmuramoyl-L-alanine amidase [Streptomyces sp. H27-C3]|uniref:peptidoglycan recognition protein family protein n=1 Tax=Streptomyces sp. H27-C3 TaxID=3046305 RepID=UPI0024BA3896|nr:N-acetylmuramoyl-L-alanine amidase [Streptomyces sp. H27-C3]MDJ0461546.1 N-acetylmuramoyl-L-alanine amidase [Streptomyces sp. H27-C3]